MFCLDKGLVKLVILNCFTFCNPFEYFLLDNEINKIKTFEELGKVYNNVKKIVLFENMTKYFSLG